MSSLLDATTITAFSGAFGRHYDTFSPFSTIVVHKEPIKTYTTISTDSYYGYENSNETNETLTPQSQSFNAMVIRKNANAQTLKEISQMGLNVIDGDIRIKIEKPAKIYIEEGKTENIEIDGQFYNINSSSFQQNYLGLVYYYYDLKKTA